MRMISAFLIALFFVLPAYAQSTDGKLLSVIELRKRAGYMNARNNAEKPLTEIKKNFTADDEKTDEFKKMCDNNGDFSVSGDFSEKKYNGATVKEYNCSYATVNHQGLDGSYSKVEISVKSQKPYILDDNVSSVFLYSGSIYGMQNGCCEDEDSYMNRYDLKTGKLLDKATMHKATEE